MRCPWLFGYLPYISGAQIGRAGRTVTRISKISVNQSVNSTLLPTEHMVHIYSRPVACMDPAVNKMEISDAVLAVLLPRRMVWLVVSLMVVVGRILNAGDPRFDRAIAPALVEQVEQQQFVLPPLPKAWAWAPTCRLRSEAGEPCALGASNCLCSRGDDVRNCSVFRQGKEESEARRAGFSSIGASGAWHVDGSSIYELDLGLLDGLVEVFAGASLLELGAGVGCYADALRRRGVGEVRACDGAPGIENATHGAVCTADLTERLELTPADWVLSLEVAEHIPPASAFCFLQTLRRHSQRGVVLSWSKSSSGHGHINPQHQWRVILEMQHLGFDYDTKVSKKLRGKSFLWWMRTNVLVFRKRENFTLPENATCQYVCQPHT